MRILIFIFSTILAIGCNQHPGEKSADINNKKTDVSKKPSDSIRIQNQIEEIDNNHELTITFKKNNGLYIAFRREHIDSAWTSISFGHWPHKTFLNNTETMLQKHMENIDYCWGYIEKIGEINITSLRLLSPHNYPDIATNQINAFNQDKEWKNKANHRIDNKATLMLVTTYNKTVEMMLRYDIYKPINDFLKQKGFSISDYAVEKMGYISEEKQRSTGIENPVLVPSPLKINIYVSKIKHQCK